MFRVSGGVESIQKLQRELDLGDFKGIASVRDEHVVTGIIKLVLRNMPRPLLTWDLYDAFCELSRVQLVSKQLEVLKDLVRRLPGITNFFLRPPLHLPRPFFHLALPFCSYKSLYAQVPHGVSRRCVKAHEKRDDCYELGMLPIAPL